MPISPTSLHQQCAASLGTSVRSPLQKLLIGFKDGDLTASQPNNRRERVPLLRIILNVPGYRESIKNDALAADEPYVDR